MAACVFIALGAGSVYLRKNNILLRIVLYRFSWGFWVSMFLSFLEATDLMMKFHLTCARTGRGWAPTWYFIRCVQQTDRAGSQRASSTTEFMCSFVRFRIHPYSCCLPCKPLLFGYLLSLSLCFICGHTLIFIYFITRQVRAREPGSWTFRATPGIWSG